MGDQGGKAHALSLRQLRLRRDAEDRQRIRQQVAEDREQRAVRADAHAAPPPPAAPGPSAAGGTATSTVLIRCPDGSSRRHTFPAETTLAEVRAWLRGALAEPEQPPLPARGFAGGSRSLVPNELARLGREHFERQTERMRMDARRLRLGAGGGAPAHADDQVDGAGAAAAPPAAPPLLFFFVPSPRRDFADEEAMRTTTLAAAMLVPSGTLMVRAAGELSAAPAGQRWPRTEAAAARLGGGVRFPFGAPGEDGEEEDEDDEEGGGEEEGEFDEEMGEGDEMEGMDEGEEEGEEGEEGEEEGAEEAADLFAQRLLQRIPAHSPFALPMNAPRQPLPATRPSLAAGRALGGGSAGAPDAGAPAPSAADLRRARLDAIARREAELPTADGGVFEMPPPFSAVAAPPAPLGADGGSSDGEEEEARANAARRADALRAAMARSDADPAPPLAAAPPAPAAPAAPAPAAGGQARAAMAPRTPAAAAAAAAAREKALLAAQERAEQQPPSPFGGASAGAGAGRAGQRSILARAAGAGLLAAAPAPPPGATPPPAAEAASAGGSADGAPSSGIGVAERERRFAEQQAARRKQVAERERIRRTLAEDRNLRFAPAPHTPAGAPLLGAPTATAATAAAGASASSPARAGFLRPVSLRLKLESGETLLLSHLSEDAPLEAVFAEVEGRRGASDPFVLRAVLPAAEHRSDSAAHRARTLGEAGLAPSASLLVASAALRGTQRTSAGAVRGLGGEDAETARALAGLHAERLGEPSLDALQAHVLARADECIPAGSHELDIFLVGEGAHVHTHTAGVGVLSATRAEAACVGRQDFTDFEPIDGALRDGQRIVIAAQRGDASLGTCQAYLASTLRRWLLELKRDGAGRVVAQTQHVDPLTRRQFTREQVVAILLFGAAERAPGGGASAAAEPQ